jgi:hypothetical protein
MKWKVLISRWRYDLIFAIPGSRAEESVTLHPTHEDREGRTAAVINCSHPHYNLGAAKLANWLRSEGWDVQEFGGDPGMFGMDFDLVALSVIFTWHAPIAREIAWRVSGRSEVWCGGPGIFRLLDWWRANTGLDAHKGLDQRIERQAGDYRMGFASRGCPVGCHFCIVPKLEGLEFTLDWDFVPAPILCDNNLSALPVEFQDHILRRYRDTNTQLLDANSGFEPQYFDGGTYERWKPQLRGPWRFAFDMMPEWRHVKAMMKLLENESSRKKQVYVLIGNEPVDTCYERAMKVIEWGGEPYCQPYMALDTLDKEPKVLHDWTMESVKDFARFFNRRLWRSMAIGDYMPRKFQKNPFSELVLA